MRMLFSIVGMVLSTSIYAQTYDLPPHPESGKCYVRCLPKENKKPTWDKIDCALISFQKLEVTIENTDQAFSKKDAKIIDKKLVPYIKKGYRLQIRSHYVSSAADSINVKISSQRAIAVGNYLVERGMNPELLFINSLGSLKVKKIELEYRVVNVSLE
ncbi:OmpA family protein [uncultured Dokdonia sp.]|uniref:OmpA family protein n=1 Tax=uncultured Dokdonia sp. TaxID=575653 RepID=UPI002609AF5A|nr:OmpA family protein [uncultured Dokdonia sp.]